MARRWCAPVLIWRTGLSSQPLQLARAALARSRRVGRGGPGCFCRRQPVPWQRCPRDRHAGGRSGRVYLDPRLAPGGSGQPLPLAGDRRRDGGRASCWPVSEYWLVDVFHLTGADFFLDDLSICGMPIRWATPAIPPASRCWSAVAGAGGYGQRGGRRFLAVAGVFDRVAGPIHHRQPRRPSAARLRAWPPSGGRARQRPGWVGAAPRCLAGAILVAAAAFAVANPRIRALLGPAGPECRAQSQRCATAGDADRGTPHGCRSSVLGWGLGATPLAYPRYRSGLDGGVENVLQLHCTPSNFGPDWERPV